MPIDLSKMIKIFSPLKDEQAIGMKELRSMEKPSSLKYKPKKQKKKT